MSKNKPFKVEKRHFTFLGGICLCLFSVVLILNVGYPARAIALPFVYLFGLTSYLFYIFVYAYGLSLFFREKGFKIRPNNYLFGSLIIYLSVVMIATLIISNGATVNGAVISLTYKKTDEANNIYNFYDFYNNHVFNALKTNTGKDYWRSPFINLFQGNKFGGGLLGYAIVGTLNGLVPKTGSTLTWVVAVFVFLLGAFVLFFPIIRKMVLKGKSTSKERAPQKATNNAKPKATRIDNYNSISTASSLDDKVVTETETREEPASSVNPINQTPNYNSRYENGGTMDNNIVNNYRSGSSFVPARFYKYQIKNQAPQETNPEPLPPMNNEEQAKPQPIVNEQMELNFNERPVLNESLVRAQPQFVEPVNVAPAPMNRPQPQPSSVQMATRKPIKWVPPSTQLLETMEVQDAIDMNNQVAEERMTAMNEVFANFHVGAICNTYVVGPSVTRYNIEYQASVSVRDVDKLIKDISVRLGGVSARFEGIVEGQTYSGLEVPNAKITAVPFKEVYESLPDVKKHPLAVVFGKSIDNKFVTADFDEFPHVLVSGTTGSGKSVYTHSIICTLIMRNSPEDLKLVLIDPKKVEMNKYRDIPHLLCPIINEANTAKLTLSKLVDEMNRRYNILDETACSNIRSYNAEAEENGWEKMPYIVVFIDEYADLVDVCKDISQPVVSIAQKARAAGIHMLIATQRPSTNVITGVIKGNLPTRVALAVASQVDSVTILGEGGAEKLLGKGDMLVQSPLVSRVGMVRLQGCYIQDKEIKHIAGYLKEHYECIYDPNFCNLVDSSAQAAGDILGSPEFKASQDNGEEAKYQQIKEWVMANEYMSMSRIQRECAVGFNRAGRFFKRLQEEGVVAEETEGNKGCPVLVHDKFYEGSADTDIPVSSDQSEF